MLTVKIGHIGNTNKSKEDNVVRLHEITMSRTGIGDIRLSETGVSWICFLEPTSPREAIVQCDYTNRS